MANELVKSEQAIVEIGLLKGENAKALIKSATDISEPLAQIIEQKQLYTVIGGKKHVQVEGWTTLIALLGIVPREVSSTRHDDGSWESVVELVRIADQTVVGRASSLCGGSEATWGKREQYAVKSMATTRATGKACRLGFSWIMALSGYQPTPAEEMPREEKGATAPADRQPPQETDFESETKQVEIGRMLKEMYAGDVDDMKEALIDITTFEGKDGKPKSCDSIKRLKGKGLDTTLGKVRTRYAEWQQLAGGDEGQDIFRLEMNDGRQGTRLGRINRSRAG